MRTTANLFKHIAVEETTTTAGLGPYVLNGATASNFRFSDAYSDGDTITYRVTDGPNVEIVTGVFDLLAGELSRDTIIVSSNNDDFISWRSNSRRLIRPLTAPPAAGCPGMIIVSDAVGWNFPPMVDSPTLVLSTWIYLRASQLQTHYASVGDLFHNNLAYLFRSPSLGQFISVGGSSHADGVSSPDALAEVISATRTNPCVMTTRGIHGVTPGAITTAWIDHNFTGFGPSFSGFTEVLSVTPTTITLDFNATGAPNPWNPILQYQVLNSFGIDLFDSTFSSEYFWITATPIPQEQLTNLLIKADMNHPAGQKIMQVFYGDTEIFPSRVSDVSPAFSIGFSEPNGGTDESDSWGIGTEDFGGGFLTCFMGEFVFAPGKDLDFLNPTQRAKFHDATNHPVSLGANGSAPFGSPPTLYLSQPRDNLGSLPVKGVDPCGVPHCYLTGEEANVYRVGFTNGITSSTSLVFSMWIDNFTVGDILDIGGTLGQNGNINLFNNICTVSLGGAFQFSFPYDVGIGGNIRCSIDMNQLIGSKVVLAYVNNSPAVITILNDFIDNLSIDWTGTVYCFFYSLGYVGDFWIAPDQLFDPVNDFIDAGGNPVNLGVNGELTSFGVSPSIYFHIAGSQSANDFAINLGTGGPFNRFGSFSLISATPFLVNRAGNGDLKPAQFQLQFEPLTTDLCTPPLPLPSNSESLSVSADGTIVVGGSFINGNISGPHAFRWDSGTGMVDLGVLPGDSQSTAFLVSADGTTITGISTVDYTLFPTRAFVWTAGGGMVDIGNLGGVFTVPQAISADGSTVVGMALDGSGTPHPFKWTSAGGIVSLGGVGGGSDQSLAVSSNGSTIVGQFSPAGPPDNHAFRWNGSILDIDQLGTLSLSAATAVSANGSIAYGYFEFTLGVINLCSWTLTGTPVQTDLGAGPGPANNPYPNGISSNGAIAGGELSSGNNRGFVWDATNGFTDVGDLGSGITNILSGLSMLTYLFPYPGRKVAGSLSADGTTLIGQSYDASFNTFAVKWDVINGLVSLGDLGAGGLYSNDQANSVSEDGSVIVGRSDVGSSLTQAFRWTQSGGMVNLGSL